MTCIASHRIASHRILGCKANVKAVKSFFALIFVELNFIEPAGV
jgi:hypothetical protein